MEWIKAHVSTTSEGVEPVLGVLLSCGIGGAQIIDAREMKQFLNEHPRIWDYLDESVANMPEEAAHVVFYVSADPAGRDQLSLVQDSLRRVGEIDMGFSWGTLAVQYETVDDESWLHEWKKYYKPFRMGRSVMVRPIWEDYQKEPTDVVFTIDPGSVFGTGLHPSTQLCVEALESYLKPGDRVLDIGCGSGILSIIALLLGADAAWACDYEPAAALSALENAAHNHIEPARYTVLTGNIFTDEPLQAELGKRTYHLVVANIVADVVMGLAPLAPAYLTEGGLYIISGIIDERMAEVCEAMTRHGFQMLHRIERDGWCCAVCRRDGNHA